MYYVNARFEGGALPSEARLGVARMQGAAFVRDASSDTLFAQVNSDDHLVYAPATAMGAKELYFTRIRKGTLVTEICVSILSDDAGAYSRPKRLEIAGTLVEAPTLTDDGTRIYYHKKTSTGRHHVFTMRRRQSRTSGAGRSRSGGQSSLQAAAPGMSP